MPNGPRSNTCIGHVLYTGDPRALATEGIVGFEPQNLELQNPAELSFDSWSKLLVIYELYKVLGKGLPGLIQGVLNMTHLTRYLPVRRWWRRRRWVKAP